MKALSWRYATQKFDTTKNLSPEQLDGLLEAARLAPSSFGLQPWKMVVVKDPELRQQLRAAAWNQPQITEASDLVVFCNKTGVDTALIDGYLQAIAEVRGQSLEDLANFKKTLVGFKDGLTPEKAQIWCQKQAYIALGFLLTAAAVAQIDACPMEGFDHAAFTKLLGVDADGFEATVVCALGFRSADDKVAERKKVRLPFEKVVELR